MLKNNNQAIIKKLSLRNFKNNKIRNIISIIAIILTTVLFTSLFTVGYSMLEAFNSYKFMQYGTLNHAQLQDVSDKQINKLKKNELIDKNTIGIVKNIETIKNPELSTQTVNLTIYDENSIKNAPHIEMVKGSLPKTKDEIMLPTIVLDLLKLPYEIGTEVKLDIPKLKNGTLTGETETFTFKLSGYFKYKVSNVMNLHDVFTSEEFYNEYKNNNEVGPTCISFNFKSDKNLESQLQQVIKDIEPYNGKASINPAYLDTQVNNISEIVKNILPIILMIVLIFMSGYLLIYNIFYISVVKDIKHYGLLKTIGTSPTQIKKLVLNQANVLCLIAIPIGLIIGYLLGVVFVPIVGNMLDGLNRSSFENFNIWIFVFAAVFSYITVRISCKKPSKVASSVSPIEAIRYNERDNNIKKTSKKGRTGSKLHKMALANMFRNKKKALLVLVSMSLSCMIFLGVATILSSSDPQKAGDNILMGDIEIKHGALWQILDEETPSIPIDENIIKELENIKGVNSVQEIYEGMNPLVYEGKIKEELLSQEVDKEYKDWIYDGGEPSDYAESQGVIYYIDLMGLSTGSLMKKIIEINDAGYQGDAKILYGEIDIDKFNKGGYIIVNGHKNSKIKVGDKINLKYLKGKLIEDGYTENEFEVMAILDGAKNFNMSLYVNENDLKKVDKKAYIQKVVINTDKKYVDEVEKEVRKINEKYNNPYTQVYSKSSFIEEAKKMQTSITVIGMCAVVIIGAIGILNFINTMITNIISRKKEFAMIEAVGMTKKQLKKMLMLEGLYYAIIITISNLTLGSVASVIGYNVMKLRYSVYTYPVGAMVLCSVVVFLISVIVPVVVYNVFSKDSVVERIRTNE
ncbi:MAG: ABC transporter permease [Peptostreptococcaceae bacterium]